jgi:hypothetical protein|tara:strand:+ start:24527 stop:24661 length:135 start_codon:yes stop_codon:yes gene_type:complete
MVPVISAVPTHRALQLNRDELWHELSMSMQGVGDDAARSITVQL